MSDLITLQTPCGTTCTLLSVPRAGAPTLLLLALSGEATLSTDPYRRIGLILHAQGWNVVSLDLPCHGADRRAGEPEGLLGWAARVRAGEDFVAPFQQRVADVLGWLVAEHGVDPARLAASGFSRGGYLAMQAAAAIPQLVAVAAIAPVTVLPVLRELAGMAELPLVQRLALAHAAPALADRACWMVIGNADDRVDTDACIACSRALVHAAQHRALAPNVTLHVVPSIGHSTPESYQTLAAEWLRETVGKPNA